MNEWSADGIGSSRDRGRDSQKGHDRYKSDAIDVSQYSKREGNGSSARRDDSNGTRGGWKNGSRNGDFGHGDGSSSSSTFNSNQNRFLQQSYRFNGPYDAFAGNQNAMMNGGYAGQYMGNTGYNNFALNGFVPPFMPPGGFSMDAQGQFQGGQAGWGNAGQLQSVDNGWGRKVNNGKLKNKGVKQPRHQKSEDEDSDARERRKERLKRRRRSAGLDSDSNASAEDNDIRDDRGRRSPDSAKRSRDREQQSSKREVSRDVSRFTSDGNVRTDRGSGVRRRSDSKDRDRSNRQRSASRERHSSHRERAGIGRDPPQERKTGSGNDSRDRHAQNRSHHSSESGSTQRHRDRADETHREGEKRRNHYDVGPRAGRERQSTLGSTSATHVDNYSGHTGNGHERRARDNIWGRKKSNGEKREDRLDSYGDQRDGRDRDTRHRQLSQKSENERDLEAVLRRSKREEDLHSNQRGRESMPSDAMQAAMEAALREAAPPFDKSVDSRASQEDMIIEEEVPPPPIIRARPDEVYEQISQVGEGTYGQVYKAKGDRTGVIVALKKIRMESEKDGFPITAMREIKLLQGLRHENVVRLHEMLLSKNSVYMVFEYLQHDLNGILAQPSIVFEPCHRKSLAQQLLLGLAYLHRHSILHRDLKGSNLLLNSEGTLKLADFGLARRYTKRSKSNVDYTNRVVTLWYRPPELLFGETCYNDAIDVWGAGCIFLELFTKKPVFQGNDEIHQVQVLLDILGPIQKQDWPGVETLPWYDLVRPRTDDTGAEMKEEAKGLRLLFDKKLPSDALDVAEALLRYDPSRRVSASQALRMNYFTRNTPRPEKPREILSRVDGEWHEFESRHAKRMQPPTLEMPTSTSTAHHQRKTDSPQLTHTQKVEMGPPLSHPSPNLLRAAMEKGTVPA